jgi:suppressor of ftsI
MRVQSWLPPRQSSRRDWRQRAASAALLLVGTLLLTFGSYGALRWPGNASGRSADGANAERVSFSQGGTHGGAQGRVVRYTLTADEQEWQIGPKRVRGKGYNNDYRGPTLYLRPGDTLDLKLVNRLSRGTNLHFHGMHVSPTGLSDNIFRLVPAGTTARYVVKLPLDIDPGLYWYHSHQHSHTRGNVGLSEEQVFGGMSGLIVVEGLPELLPRHLRNIPDKLFALKDFQDHNGVIPTRNIDSDAPTNRTVNGQFNPRIDIKPGETQLWRFGNIGADIFYDLQLQGIKFHVVAQDANPVWKVWEADHLVMPPGSRFEVLVQGPKAGTYTLKTRAYNMGPGGDQYPETRLATVVSAGKPQRPAALPAAVVPKTVRWGYLNDQPIARQRTTTFMEREGQPDANTYFIDNKQFNPNVNNVEPRLGTTEQWTVRNTSTEQHPFHIHQDDFQIMSINGRPYNANGQQDTIALPYNGGQVVIRDLFHDFTGRFVYHCHILNHEDLGMMLVVDVVGRDRALPKDDATSHGEILITGEAH